MRSGSISIDGANKPYGSLSSHARVNTPRFTFHLDDLEHPYFAIPTTEHIYLAGKYLLTGDPDDQEIAKSIMQSVAISGKFSPSTMFDRSNKNEDFYYLYDQDTNYPAGHRLFNFKSGERHHPLATNGNAFKFKIQSSIQEAKFTQNLPLFMLLLSTDNSNFVTPSETDEYWQKQFGELLQAKRHSFQSRLKQFGYIPVTTGVTVKGPNHERTVVTKRASGSRVPQTHSLEKSRDALRYQLQDEISDVVITQANINQALADPKILTFLESAILSNMPDMGMTKALSTQPPRRSPRKADHTKIDIYGNSVKTMDNKYTYELSFCITQFQAALTPTLRATWAAEIFKAAGIKKITDIKGNNQRLIKELKKIHCTRLSQEAFLAADTSYVAHKSGTASELRWGSVSPETKQVRLMLSIATNDWVRAAIANEYLNKAAGKTRQFAIELSKHHQPPAALKPKIKGEKRRLGKPLSSNKKRQRPMPVPPPPPPSLFALKPSTPERSTSNALTMEHIPR